MFQSLPFLIFVTYLLFKVMEKAIVEQSLYFFTLMTLGLLEEFQSF